LEQPNARRIDGVKERGRGLYPGPIAFGGVVVRGVWLRNTSRDQTFKDRFAGETYEIPPLSEAVVPVGAAKLWLGDWTLTGREALLDRRRAERRRHDNMLAYVYRIDPGRESKQEDAPEQETYQRVERVVVATDSPTGYFRVCQDCGAEFTDPRKYAGHRASHSKRR